MTRQPKKYSLDERYERHYEPAAASLRHCLDQGKRRLIVTSKGEGAGKTTTTLYLGRQISRMGIRTLLIDGDFFRANLSYQLDLKGEGLSNLASGAALCPERVLDIEHLYGIGPGLTDKPQPDAIEWVGSHAPLQELIEGFECTLIDTPPLSASNDAILWGRVADGCLLVVTRRSMQTSKEAWLAATLREEDIPILGIVLTHHRRPELGPRRSWLGRVATSLGLQA